MWACSEIQQNKENLFVNMLKYYAHMNNDVAA